ncbi:MAG: N-acetyl-alpha-D-glucosaminyl L-malate synthase BshA [Fibrobacterota bacterium]
MKIGITCYPTFGGSGAVATQLGRALADAGHTVHFISSSLPYKLRYHSHPRIFFHEVEQVNYPLFEDHSPYILLLASKMAEIAKSERLDILHVHYAIPHALAAHTACQVLGRRRPRIVTTLHGTDVTLIGALASLKDLTRYSIRKSDGITAVSEYLKRKTAEVFGIRGNLRVIPNFFSRHEFNPKLRPCPCFKKKSRCEKAIIHISNFRKVKRIPDVITVFKGIADAMSARLILVGDGPEMCTAREMLTRFRLLDRTEFLGLRYNVAPILRHADLMLHPSDHESFGVSPLEALACGVPVIATRGSGLSEVVADGQNGLLSAPGDTKKMISDALSLLSDHRRHTQFSRHAAEWALENFEADRVVPRYVSCYREVLGR